MSPSGFVDWGLAERLALALGGGDGAPGAFDQQAVDSACTDAVALALDYSRLRPAAELPPPELIDRGEWARLGLRTLRELSEQFERRVAEGLSPPRSAWRPRPLPGGSRGGRRGRDRGRLWGAQGTRPVRRAVGAE